MARMADPRPRVDERLGFEAAIEQGKPEWQCSST